MGQKGEGQSVFLITDVLRHKEQAVYLLGLVPVETQHRGGVCSRPSVQDPRAGLAPGQRVHPGHIQSGQLCQGE